MVGIGLIGLAFGGTTGLGIVGTMVTPGGRFHFRGVFSEVFS